MGTSVKGLLKGLRYITQIFDEEEKDNGMQIGFPTDVKHVAHIGSDGPAANAPSWMNDFKAQENENAQVVSRGDVNNNEVGEGVGLQELLPPPEKQKHKKSSTRRNKSETSSQNGSPPPRRNSSASLSDVTPKPSRRHHRSRHGSIDSNDPSVRRRRVVAVTDMEAAGSCPVLESTDAAAAATTRKSTSRSRKLKGSGGGGGGGGGELSMRKTKGKSESSSSTSSNVQSINKCNNSVSDKD